MLPLLMVYGVVAGFILLIAAFAGEAMLGALRLPRRWAWVFCLGTLIVLTLAAPLRSVRSAPDSLAMGALDGARAVESTAVPQVASLSLTELAERIINAPVTSVALLLDRPAASGVSDVLASAWAVASLMLLIGLVLTTVRNRRARRAWPLRRVADVPVRISCDAGPALFGVLRPDIVLPAWLLERPDAEQRMIVAHERAHLEARDPLLLLLGCIAVVLLPWNPFAWCMSRRLRLALEMDCDARVLRGATSSLPYAQILVATAERRATLRFLSAALADSQSDLERRLNAMNRTSTSHPVLRAVAAAATAGLFILAACEAELPTSAELDAMNAGEIVEAATPLASVENAVYFVDGVETDAETASAIAPDMIATVNIRKGAVARAGTDASSVIEITTHDASRPLAISGEATFYADRAVFNSSDSSPIEIYPHPNERPFDGLLLIDGKRAELTALRRLDPETIESIEVVKGAAAERMFTEPEALNGVIVVRMKATPLMKNR